MSRLSNDNKPDRSHVLKGSVINRRHQILNQATRGRGHGSIMGGGGEGQIDDPPAIIGVATISNEANDCPNPGRPDEPVGAPCKQDGLYLARLRYYDWGNKEWADSDEDLDLDANALTPRPEFSEGQRIPVFWDHMRGSLIPISGAAPVQKWLGEPLEVIEHNTVGEFQLLKKTTENPQLQEIPGETRFARNLTKMNISPGIVYELHPYESSGDLIASPIQYDVCRPLTCVWLECCGNEYTNNFSTSLDSNWIYTPPESGYNIDWNVSGGVLNVDRDELTCDVFHPFCQPPPSPAPAAVAFLTRLASIQPTESIQVSTEVIQVPILTLIQDGGIVISTTATVDTSDYAFLLFHPNQISLGTNEESYTIPLTLVPGVGTEPLLTIQIERIGENINFPPDYTKVCFFLNGENLYKYLNNIPPIVSSVPISDWIYYGYHVIDQTVFDSLGAATWPAGNYHKFDDICVDIDGDGECTTSQSSLSSTSTLSSQSSLSSASSESTLSASTLSSVSTESTLSSASSESTLSESSLSSLSSLSTSESGSSQSSFSSMSTSSTSTPSVSSLSSPSSESSLSSLSTAESDVSSLSSQSTLSGSSLSSESSLSSQSTLSASSLSSESSLSTQSTLSSVSSLSSESTLSESSQSSVSSESSLSSASTLSSVSSSSTSTLSTSSTSTLSTSSTSTLSTLSSLSTSSTLSSVSSTSSVTQADANCVRCLIGTLPDQVNVTIPANELTDDGCTDCDNANATWTLDNVESSGFPTCKWFREIPANACSQWIWFELFATEMEVRIEEPGGAGAILYKKSYSPPIDCSKLNETLPFDSHGGNEDCGSAGTSVTVTNV